MPILDLQQRMMEKGRIRLGHKVSGTTRAGKAYTRPAKLETFKLTSADRQAVDAAAALYGGQVEPFNDGEYGVVTDAVALNVILVPGEMGWSQWREMWGNKVCHRRCDGVRETISDGPCQCPADPAERAAQAANGRACKDTTRLSVMLPDLPGLGLWRLESHGFYAATELAGTIAILSMLAPGTLVRGRLLAEQREVVRLDAEGKPRTNKFVVPVLDLPDVRLSELVAPDGGVGVQIEAPARRGLSPVPVAELPEGPRPSIAEQVAAVPDKPKPRKNAAAPLPATGLSPRKSSGEVSGPVPPAGASPAVPAPDPEAPGVTAPVESAASDGEVGSAPVGGAHAPGGKNATGGGQEPAHSTAATVAEACRSPQRGASDEAPLGASTPSGGCTLDDLDAALPTPKWNRNKVLREARRIATEEIGLEKPPTEFDDLAKPEYAPILTRMCELVGAVAGQPKPLTDKQRGFMHAVWAKHGGDDARKAAISRLTSGRTDSSSELTADEVSALMDLTAELDKEEAA